MPRYITFSMSLIQIDILNTTIHNSLKSQEPVSSESKNTWHPTLYTHHGVASSSHTIRRRMA
jgi:transcriptional regulator of heat shock response